MTTRTDSVRRSRVARGILAVLILLSCVQEQPYEPARPLIPPRPPDQPQILSAAWTIDVFRNQRSVVIRPPTRGLERRDLQILADYFGVAPGGPELSILAGDVIEMQTPPGTFSSSSVGAFMPGLVRTTFAVAIRNRLTGVDIVTPTFPPPPPGTSGVVLFPFHVAVTATPGGVSVGGDGTTVLVELPNRGRVAPSVDWDVAPFNFFNDVGCGATANDCYRSETFHALDGSPRLLAGATSESRVIGFDHDPTVSQFRVRMIVAGDLLNGTPNSPPSADAGGPYSTSGRTPIRLQGTGTDPDSAAQLTYAWDFDQDGQFDDPIGALPLYECPAPGTATITLRVLDERSAAAFDQAEVTCIDEPITVNMYVSSEGVLGGPVGVSALGYDDFFPIASYEWDLDNDGAFDDGTETEQQAFCASPSGTSVRVRVTNTQGETAVGSAGIGCLAQAVGDVRTRWVNAAGNDIASARLGERVALEVDIETGRNIVVVVGRLLWNFDIADLTRTIFAPPPIADLNCNGSNVHLPGRPSCPSGIPPANHVDRLAALGWQVTHPPGSVMFANVDNPGIGASGIQGIARFDFTVLSASPGLLMPRLTLQSVYEGPLFFPVALTSALRVNGVVCNSRCQLPTLVLN